MRILGMDIRRTGAEQRATVVQSDPNFMQVMGLDAYMQSASGITVTEDKAMGVPAIFAAVNFLAGTMAGLPLNVFKRNKDDRQRVSDTPLAVMLHDAANEGLSSFDWRKYFWERVFTSGRGLTFIERDAARNPINLWPLVPEKTTIKVENGRKFYEYKETGVKTVRYEASEIIDVAFMLKSDGVSHRSPIMANKDVIALAIAATEYGSKFFQNGGVPPFAVTGSFQSGQAMGRAADDIATAVKKAAKEQRQALVMPMGMDIKQIGADVEKTQLVELKRFLVEEMARIWGLPPVFLQDLSHGTFSNTEQQDLQLTKHTIKRHVEQFEQELNLKLFGRGNRKMFVEMNMDGLLRGDFKTRMEGYAAAVQNGGMTPNETRQMENRPALPGGDQLMIQGATVPIGQQPNGGANGA
jgi:HK97 family phage portal protein